MLKEAKTVITSLIVSSVLLAGYHFFVFEKQRERIYFFDLTGHLSVLQNAFVSGKISAMETQEILADMKRALFEVKEGKRVIILPKEVVMNSEKRPELEVKYTNEKFNKLLKAFLDELEKQRQNDEKEG